MSTEAMTEIERINVLLPTELFAGSKDWRVGSIADRVDWLLTMYSSAKEEVERLQSALEAQPQQEPVAWAISYDGETPYAIWPDGDGALLDLEVKRQGGTTCKLPLYISAPAQEFTCSTGLCHYRKPLTDEQVSAIWKAVPNQALYEAVMVFARDIEAAHGIKE